MKWEYKVMRPRMGGLPQEEDLAPLGEEGWELVKIDLDPYSGPWGGVKDRVMFFKRPVEEE